MNTVKITDDLSYSIEGDSVNFYSQFGGNGGANLTIAFEEIDPVIEILKTIKATQQDDQLNTNSSSDVEINEIIELAEGGDIDSLVEIVYNEPDTMIRLEAAMALAQLGDEHGVDYLIYALHSPEVDINSAARKILVELNHPKGNLALQSR